MSLLNRNQQAGQSADVRVGVEPIFTVADTARAIEHYERLGFTTSRHDAFYAFAHRNELTIHLAQAQPRTRGRATPRLGPRVTSPIAGWPSIKPVGPTL
jgi:hypothetical protein